MSAASSVRRASSRQPLPLPLPLPLSMPVSAYVGVEGDNGPGYPDQPH